MVFVLLHGVVGTTISCPSPVAVASDVNVNVEQASSVYRRLIKVCLSRDETNEAVAAATGDVSPCTVAGPSSLPPSLSSHCKSRVGAGAASQNAIQENIDATKITDNHVFHAAGSRLRFGLLDGDCVDVAALHLSSFSCVF